MPLIRSTVSVVVITTISLSGLLVAQVGLPNQPRDPAPQQPTERRIPVGTSSIAGTVVTSDTGRPVPGARVSVSGQVTANAAAAAAALSGSRGGASAASGVGAIPPVAVGLARGGVVVGQVTGGNGAQSALTRTVITDSSGQFSFPRLPAGQFTIAVFQSQFLSTNYGQRRPGGQGQFIQLADGQQITVKVPMLRGAVITGLVVGPDGEPQRSAQVRGWRLDKTNGFRRLQPVGFAQTDDRGIYRMFGLQPGDYFVSATPNESDLFNAQRSATQADLTERTIVSGPVLPPAAAGLTPTVSVPIAPQPVFGPMSISSAYLPTYAPSSMAPSGATMVTVAGGEERMGVDVRVQLTQASNIQGTISTPLDAGVTVQVSLMSDDQTIDSPQTNTARPDASGRFMFRAVAPGTYTVFAQTVAAPAPVTIVNGQPVQPPQPQPVLTESQKMWGKTQVTVAGEPVIGVNVSLQPARSISGIVVFEMAHPPDLSRSRLSVTISPAPSPQQTFFGGQPQASVGPDGRFTITGVLPGRFIVRINGGVMKSSVVSGQDTLDFPLDFTSERDVTDAVLTVTDQISELTGTLTDSSGKPAMDYMIVAAASDSRYWVPGSRRIAMTRPGPDGRYTFRSLAPGTYDVAAVIDLEPGAQYDPEFLRTVARASVPVTIMDGGKVSQDLRVK